MMYLVKERYIILEGFSKRINELIAIVVMIFLYIDYSKITAHALFNPFIYNTYFLMQSNAQAPTRRDSQNQFGIVIHGGAGTILRTDMTLEMDTAYRQLLQEAVTTGHAILASGGSSTEAVEKQFISWRIHPSLMQGKEPF